jgi:hypothetical protein
MLFMKVVHYYDRELEKIKDILKNFTNSSQSHTGLLKVRECLNQFHVNIQIKQF